MNKIIILGHDASGYGSLESFLLRCGMQTALPTSREGLLPKDIHQILRKAHQIPESQGITEERGFHPVSIRPVWNGMAMDLLLGNLGREPWGWADTDTLMFLEFWRSLDPDSMFAMVYDDPASVFHKHGFDVPDEAREKGMRNHLDNWFAYNSAMLRFYFRNIERCVLIHSGALQSETGCGMQEILAKFGGPHAIYQADPDAQPAPVATDDPALTLTTAECAISNTVSATESPTARFLIEYQLDEYPQYRSLYSELQSVADLPQVTPPAHANNDRSRAWYAWANERNCSIEKIQQYRNQSHSMDERIQTLQQQHDATILQLSQANREMGSSLEQIQKNLQEMVIELENSRKYTREACQERDAIASQSSKTNKELVGKNNVLEIQLLENKLRITEMDNERKLTFLQIIQAEEELAQSLRMNSMLRREVDALHAPQPKPGLVPPTGAAERVKEQLSYRLGALMVQKSKSPVSCLLLPVFLVCECISYHCERKVRRRECHLPLQEYADAEAAWRVKQQLSYRLGNALVRRSRSPVGWLMLPFALIRQMQTYHARRKDNAPCT